MKAFLLLFLHAAFFVTACSQEEKAAPLPSTLTPFQLPVGETTLEARQYTFANEAPFLLFQIHSDEITAGEAAYQFAHQNGITFLQLLNGQNRLVSFTLASRRYLFDPNRIFSAEGIRKTLQLSGRYTDAAFREVKRFSDSLLSLLGQNKPIVAVHNNTDGHFTILQYKEAGSGRVHLNAAQDIDDFFITNDEAIFQALQEKNVNVVLEEASQMEEDGSLSLYCGRKGIRYINVEAEHGHLEQQLEMLALVYTLFN